MKIFIYALVLLSLIHCSGFKKKRSMNLSRISQKFYQTAIQKNSQKFEVYKLMEHVFQGNVLFLNQRMQRAMTDRKAFLYAWKDSEREKQSQRLQRDNLKKSVFILSFYSSNHSINKIHLSGTEWSVFLKKNNKKIYGKVSYISKDFLVLKSMYPFHHRFNKLYKISFPIPLDQLEKESFSVHLMHYTGSVEVLFKPQI